MRVFWKKSEEQIKLENNAQKDFFLCDCISCPELNYIPEENAEVLVSQSAEFDTWLNEVVFDLDNFRSEPKREVPKKTGGNVSKS